MAKAIWIMAIFLIAVIFMSGCASKTAEDISAPSAIEDAQEAEQPSAKTESEITEPHIVITYNGEVVDRTFPDSDYNEAPVSGKVFFQITMTVENNGYERFNTAPYQFKLKSNNKLSYDYAMNTIYLDDALTNLNVLNGETLTGSILFEIPLTAVSLPFELKYDGVCSGGKSCYIIWEQA